jgi:hypothetical protein
MVTPVYALEAWLARLLGTTSHELVPRDGRRGSRAYWD